MSKYRVLGVMSGSSLDGLDFCLADFTQINSTWQFQILKCLTIDFPEDLKDKLKLSDKLPSTQALDESYGEWIGNEIKVLFDRVAIDLIGIHGHTTIHKPSEGISVQIGNAQRIASITGIKTVDNFRLADIKKGGQGAPLVPVGEFYLFPQFNGFVNLGGICNATVRKEDGKMMAWDISPCNQVLNYFANQLGEGYDKGGQIARSGSMDHGWYQELAADTYFSRKPPKSIGNHWVKEGFFNTKISPDGGLRTFSEFIGYQISKDITDVSFQGKILVTGGGAFNNYLIECIEKSLPKNIELVIPDDQMVQFKEALIFGFLGLRRMLNLENVFASVTGALSNSIAGDLYSPDS